MCAKSARPDALADYRDYIVARFADDAHLWALGALMTRSSLSAMAAPM